MEKGGGIVQTSYKPLKKSSMTHEESEDMSFWESQLEGLVRGFVSKGDLDKNMYNLKSDLEKSMVGLVKTFDFIYIEERMGRMENTVGHMMDDIVENIVQLLQNSAE